MIRPSVHVISVLVVIFVSCLPTSSALRPMRPCPDHTLFNGKIVTRANGRTNKYRCNVGFKILGDKTGICIRGSWEYQEQRPVCVRNGCARIPPLLYGQTQQVDGFNGAVLNFSCDPGYTLAGSPTVYCNSRRWNATVPQCTSNVSEASTSCNFESGDLCGWSQDSNHHFDWTRYTGPTPSTSVSTGPSWDHTKGKGGSGYYMYIESSSPRRENDTARLVSPVYASELSADACFIFYYHMFGQHIGTLNVYVKPEGQSPQPPIFSVSGQQGNKWVRSIVKFDPLDENFQIVIEGVRGSSYLGDSAIDDVRLANETDCDPDAATTMEVWTDTSAPFDADVNHSCRSRCFTAPPSTGDVATVESQFDVTENVALSSCECHSACSATSTCCDDFKDYCIVAKTSPTAASATSFHRTVASSPYSPPSVSVLPLPMPPVSTKPSASPSTVATPLTSSTSPPASPTSAPGPLPTSSASRPSDKPTALDEKSTQSGASSSTINNTSPGMAFSPTTTNTPSNPPTSKTSPAVLAVTPTTNFPTTESLSVKPNTFSPVTTSLTAKGSILPTKPAISLTELTTAPSKSTSSPTKSTNAPTQSTNTPTQSTTSPTKSTNAPTQSTTSPTNSTTSPTNSTTALTKSTTAPRKILFPFTWWIKGKSTTSATPSWASVTSTTSAPPPPTAMTTRKVSAKTKDKQNSVDVKEMVAKETKYLENSQLLKERPAKSKDNSRQMAQRASPSGGLTPLALYSGLAAGLCVLLAVGTATSVFLVRKRRTELRRRFDDDSEVRFLTADEMLDFTIAQPKDEDL